MAARRAYEFVDSIGVNSHSYWNAPGYTNVTNVKNSILYLGITNVRDRTPLIGNTLPDYQDFANAGIKFLLVLDTPNLRVSDNLDEITALVTSNPGSVAGFEGANEYNQNDITYNGEGSRNNPSWVRRFSPYIQTQTRARSALTSLSLVASSCTDYSAASFTAQGDLSAWVDTSNAHIYFGNGEQPRRNMSNNIPLTRQTAPNKPLWVTETGYHTAVDGGFSVGGTPATHACYITNCLLESFLNGAQRTYLYMLMDFQPNPAPAAMEDAFGLFLSDGTPKPAATAIRNMTTLLKDTGATAKTFAPGSLAPTFTGMSGTCYSQLLQKSNGTYYLMLWNETNIWDQSTKTAVSNPTTASVTVNFGASMATVRRYSIINSTTAAQEVSNVSSMAVTLGGQAQVLEIVPTAASGGTGTGGLVTGSKYLGYSNGDIVLLTV